MQENMKRNNIRTIGIPEGEEEEQGRENLFEKVMMENFPNLCLLYTSDAADDSIRV